MKSRFAFIKILLIILVILALALGAYLGTTMFIKPATDDATESVITEIVTSNLSEDEAKKVNQAIAKMSDDDKETAKEIVSRSLEAKDVPKLAKYYREGNTEKLIDYANEHMTSEDRDKLMELYLKYA